jgi:hypothetical protein
MNNSLLPVDAKSDAFATRADSALWRQLPAFSYEPPPLNWVLTRHGLSLLLLSAWAVGATALAMVAGRRIQPEPNRGTV